MLETFEQDANVVAAIRQGDAERYRELVERHERRVFALAWSRLGDATLAEEATQEAFIRGYRRLWLLGDGSKFAGWIASIARNTAINLGLRHRRELNKRERWALEHTPDEPASDDSEEAPTPEMLRQTLAELPDAHRECLVLFYLEGKSGAEAATALGITEAALRVRLHRARGALRERLERKLEDSLEQLRPSKPLAPAIMAAVVASQSTKAVTGSVLLATLAKFTPLKWLFAVLPLVFPVSVLASAVAMNRWRTTQERKNFRDPNGFRTKLYGKLQKRAFVFLFCFAAFMGVISVGLTRHLGPQLFYIVLAAVSVTTTFGACRRLQINRTGFQYRYFLSQLLNTIAFIALGLGWLPVYSLFFIIVISSLLTLPGRYAPIARLDYNLFLRAREKMFPESAAFAAPAVSADRVALLAFARFLGERWLVSEFNWKPAGLALQLRPVRVYGTSYGSFLFGFFTDKSSHLLLGYDGTVTAHCGDSDTKALSVLENESVPKEHLEEQVAIAVSNAWQQFRRGDHNAAERTLGHVQDREIFLQSPARLPANRWTRIILVGGVGATLIGLILLHLFRPQLDGLRSVKISEAQAREFLSHVALNPNPMQKQTLNGREMRTQKAFRWDASEPLFSAIVLPDTNLFTPVALQAMHDTVAGGKGFAAWRQDHDRVQMIFTTPLPRHAVAGGWIGWNDLDLQPADAEAYLRSNVWLRSELAEHWDHFLTREQSWSWVKSQRFDVLRIGADGVAQLRLLRDIHCLDLVDREKLIQQIASVQTLSEHPPGQPPIHDWRDVRGLFFTPCWRALVDTYHSLTALEILGGLDRIDREACIEGISRRHRGNGFFTSPNSGGYNEYHISGDAQDTIAAYESLRILGALDRVKDLKTWQFRVHKRDMPNGEINWRTLEAWTAQQRLQQAIKEHRRTPQAPWRSLTQGF